MRYSFSTILMAILSSNLLLLLVTICFRNTKILLHVRYKLLMISLGIIVLRFLLPLEFPFTKNVILPRTLSMLVFYIRYPLTYIMGIKVSIWTLFVAIWIIGFLIHLYRYIKLYRKIHCTILLYGNDVTEVEPFQSILAKICKEKANPFRIIEMPDIDMPKIYGIFRPCILMPASMQFSSESLYYILSHEANHYFQYDLLIKCVINIITMFYWWNPVCALLNPQIDALLEMRTDDALTASDSQSRKEYLNCLLLMAELTAKKDVPYQNFTVSFCQDTSILTKRFQMLIYKNQKKLCIMNASFILLIISILIPSYLYILEAKYIPPSIASSNLSLFTSENTYFIKNKDGSYDLYFNNIYIENIDSIKYYSKEINIYNEEGELINEK